MDIVKIVGIGIIAVIIITIIKQYKPEFAIYVSILAGIIIFFMVFENPVSYTHLTLPTSDLV